MKTASPLTPRRRGRAALLGAVGLMLSAGAVAAQQVPPPPAIQWTPRRLDQLDRNVRRLERALNQRNAAGDPVLIQPDPEVVTLQARVDGLDRRLSDIEATMQRVNADNERLTFALDEAERDNAALRRLLEDTNTRLEALEARAEAQAELNAPIVPDSPSGDAGDDFEAAQRLTASGDAARALRAWETYVITWPEADLAAEANYRLGDARWQAQDADGAVQAYATALRGWPEERWATDAVIKLAIALEASDRAEQACLALNEFGQRYAEDATAAQRSRASDVADRAECG
jgi:TolA-binding protein